MSKFDPYDHFSIALNPDGTLTRYIKLPTAEATSENPQDPSAHDVLSKDIPLNPEKKTWMRLYRPAKLPSNDGIVARLPIIMYFHEGGWVQLSVKEYIVHERNNKIAAEVPAIVVAVEFRLAPESRLPAQYDDAWDAVMWVRDQLKEEAPNGGDKWIRDYGDCTRCYLYGSSCGANIAYNTALRVTEADLFPLRVAGAIMNQPFFGAKARTKSELRLATDQYFPLPVQDMLWDLALPVGTDRDHRYSNPFVDKNTKEKVKKLGRCLVIGFGGDPLIDRQQDFVQMLLQHGVLVEAKFDDVGFHGIDMIDMRRAMAIRNFIKEFVLH